MNHRFGRAARLAVVLALAGSATASAAGQRGGFMGAQAYHHVPYDGRFTFTRLRYNARGGGFGRGSNAWNHDYPRADRNLPLLLGTLTLIDANAEDTNILDLEDPEIFMNPVLYMWEPGGWRITEEGARNLRQYMLKGGFIVFDDFERGPLAQLRGTVPARDAGGGVHPARHVASDLPHVLRHRLAESAAPDGERDARLLRRLREQRSEGPHDGAGLPQQRRRRVPGSGPGRASCR